MAWGRSTRAAAPALTNALRRALPSEGRVCHATRICHYVVVHALCTVCRKHDSPNSVDRLGWPSLGVMQKLSPVAGASHCCEVVFLCWTVPLEGHVTASATPGCHREPRLPRQDHLREAVFVPGGGVQTVRSTTFAVFFRLRSRDFRLHVLEIILW